MDRIRQALGERRISYFGTSYGTYLGSVYLELFPKHADRFLLDSAASPRKVWCEQFRNWGLGTEPNSGRASPGETRPVAWPSSLEHYQRAVRTDRRRYPLVGAMTANITPCAELP